MTLLVIEPKWDTFREDARFLGVIGRCAFVGGTANAASGDNACVRW